MTSTSTRIFRRPALPALLAFLLAASACSSPPADTAEQGADVAEVAALVDVHTQTFVQGRELPAFQVDAGWPLLPDSLILGQVPGLSVDPEGDVWIINRPNSLSATEIGAAQDPPAAVCCYPPAHAMEFSAETGELLTMWGGSDLTPEVDGTDQWPVNVHGIFVDGGGDVWIGGNGDGDHVVLRFTQQGEFVQALGQRGRTEGNMAPDALGNPADIHHDVETGRVVVADGYINKRIVMYDAESGDFVQLWGAYGEDPGGGTREGSFDQSQATGGSEANIESTSFGDIVHCVTKGPDGRYYVCDRRNNRIQIFEENAEGEVEFVENLPIAPETGGTRTASDVAFSPDGQFMYVADMMNGQVWILDSGTYEILGAFGKNGRYPGQFIWLHSVEVDPDGNVYTTEVSTGRRVQKFVLTNGVGVG